MRSIKKSFLAILLPLAYLIFSFAAEAGDELFPITEVHEHLIGSNEELHPAGARSHILSLGGEEISELDEEEIKEGELIMNALFDRGHIQEEAFPIQAVPIKPAPIPHIIEPPKAEAYIMNDEEYLAEFLEGMENQGFIKNNRKEQMRVRSNSNYKGGGIKKSESSNSVNKSIRSFKDTFHKSFNGVIGSESKVIEAVPIPFKKDWIYSISQKKRWTAKYHFQKVINRLSKLNEKCPEVTPGIVWDMIIQRIRDMIVIDLTPEKLAELGLIIVDIRTEAEIRVSKIPFSISFREYEAKYKNKENKVIIAYDTLGFRSSDWALNEKIFDYSNNLFVSLRGGIIGWAYRAKFYLERVNEIGLSEELKGKDKKIHIVDENVKILCDSDYFSTYYEPRREWGNEKARRPSLPNAMPRLVRSKTF